MDAAGDKLTQTEQGQFYVASLDYADVFAVNADDLLPMRQPPAEYLLHNERKYESY